MTALRPPARTTVALAAGALLVAGCGGSAATATGGSPTTAATPAAATAPPLQLSPGGAAVDARATTLGTVLTDAAGRTIYLLTADGVGHRSCAGACLQVWPPVLVSGTPAAGPGVGARLGTLVVAGGAQLTVDGLPAYTFAGDTAAGQTRGQGIASFGGRWWAFDASGAAITTPGSGGPGTTAARGGY